MKHLKHCETSQNSQTLAIRCDDIGARHGNINARHGDISAPAEFPAISAWSFWQYRDCGVCITLQMCNRVTNHGDMGTFSKPA